MNDAVVRTNWIAFLLFGTVLWLLGAVVIVFPQFSSVAAGFIVGVAFTVVGLAQIAQAFQAKARSGFAWNLLTGIVEAVGGAFIFLNSPIDVVASTTLIAAVFLVQGCLQVTFAIKSRPQLGWGILLASGIFALLASASLFAHFPFSGSYEPNMVAGIFLLFAGCCYIAFAALVRWPADVWLYLDLGIELEGELREPNAAQFRQGRSSQYRALGHLGGVRARHRLPRQLCSSLRRIVA